MWHVTVQRRQVLTSAHVSPQGVSYVGSIPTPPLPRLTCHDFAGLPGFLDFGSWAGGRGPFAPDEVLSSTEWASGVVEGLNEHLLLLELDEAHLPGRERTRHWSSSCLWPGSKVMALWFAMSRLVLSFRLSLRPTASHHLTYKSPSEWLYWEVWMGRCLS